MRITFSQAAWQDYLYWQSHDPKIRERINMLIKETMRTPFTGIGKPEPLRGNLKGWWSRRITQEHRLIYRIYSDGDEQAIQIAQCRYHY